MSLNQLPYNIILQILWYVSPNKLDFGHLRSTCKRLAEITRDARFDHLVTCGNCKSLAKIVKDAKKKVGHSKECEKLPKIILAEKFGSVVVCCNCRHNINNIDKLSCLFLSMAGKNINEVMIHYITECNTTNINILKSLIANGADVHYNKGLAIREATRKGELETVKFLISCGADINVQMGRLLLYAGDSGNFELGKYLVGQGIHKVKIPLDGNIMSMLKLNIKDSEEFEEWFGNFQRFNNLCLGLSY